MTGHTDGPWVVTDTRRQRHWITRTQQEAVELRERLIQADAEFAAKQAGEAIGIHQENWGGQIDGRR